MRVIKEPDVRRQEIMDAAIRVFAEKGYDKTSIADIARESGISQGLCYRYFASKEAIYDAAIEEYADYIIRQNIGRTKLGGLTLQEQICLMSGQLEEYSLAEKGEKKLYELFHKEGNRKMHDQLFLRVTQKLIPFISGVLKAAKERGEIDVSDPEAMAYFFVFGQMGILMDPAFSEQDKSERIQSCLLEMMGLKQDETEAR